MNRLTRLPDRIKHLPGRQTGAILLTLWVFLAGCRSGSDGPAPNGAPDAGTPDLDAGMARASSLRQPLFVLVVESGLSREDALDLARRVIVLERGEPVACDSLETVLVRPRHAAVVRALGLGQIIEGESTGRGEAATVFGKVGVTAGAKRGRLRLLVRAGQPRIVAGPEGVEAEVVSLELRPSETRAVRRVAVVRVAGKLLRVILRERTAAIGDRLRVGIEGECESVEG
jgi:hypothetical protein